MLPLVNTHDVQKKKYSKSKMSHKSANQCDLTPKEKDLKDEVLEAGKIIQGETEHKE